MLRGNRRCKSICIFVCLGTLGMAFQVSANPFLMGQSVAYSSEQWPERWSSALALPVQGRRDSSPGRYQEDRRTYNDNPYRQRMENTPYNGFAYPSQATRPWGQLPRQSRNKKAKRKQRFHRNKQGRWRNEYRANDRHGRSVYSQVLPIANPYRNSFPYSTGIYPGMSPAWGTPGLSSGWNSPYGIAPLGGMGTGLPLAPGVW